MAAATKTKWASLATQDWENFYPEGPAPSFIVHAPGRVNLIGEHVDHQAYPVCPCAIVQSVGAAVSVEPKTEKNDFLELKHKSTAYKPAVYKDAKDFKVVDEKVWTNYMCAAYFGMVEFAMNGHNPTTIGNLIDPKRGLTDEQVSQSKKDPQSPLNYSIRILLDGDVPPAAGLSSSAAVVVTMTLACANASGKEPPSNRILADACAKAERYSGVASGGMDQAAILLSVSGAATLIHFKPLETESISLPKGGALVIANTCREAPKATHAAMMYNKRVFELKAGCLALLPEDTARKLSAEELLDLQLRDVVRDHLKMTEQKLLEELPKRLKQKVYKKEDMTAIFGESRKEVLLEKRCGVDVWTKNEEFYVYERIRHVLTEQQRVEDFAECTKGDEHMNDEEKLKKLGELMNGSGNSLAGDFDASCREIEAICNIARAHGAYGSRLTGAGWGGCTVSLVPEGKKDAIVAAIKAEYFEKVYDGTMKLEKPLEMLPAKEDVGQAVFCTTPSQGAFVVKL